MHGCERIVFGWSIAVPWFFHLSGLSGVEILLIVHSWKLVNLTRVGLTPHSNWLALEPNADHGPDQGYEFVSDFRSLRDGFRGGFRQDLTG